MIPDNLKKLLYSKRKLLLVLSDMNLPWKMCCGNPGTIVVYSKIAATDLASLRTITDVTNPGIYPQALEVFKMNNVLVVEENKYNYHMGSVLLILFLDRGNMRWLSLPCLWLCEIEWLFALYGSLWSSSVDWIMNNFLVEIKYSGKKRD